MGPASPSTGGIPSYIDDLLSSSLNEKFDLMLLNPLVVKRRFKKQESHLSPNEIIASIRVIIVFVRYLRSYRPDLVHVHSSSYWGFYEKALLVLLTKYLFKRKTILHIHGGRFDQFYKKAIYNKNLIRWLLKQASKTLIVSKGIKEELRLRDVIHVDNCTRFDRVPFFSSMVDLRRIYNLPQDKTVFLSAALFQKEKGLFETIDAFAVIHERRDDYYFIIAGEGPEKSRLVDYVKAKGLVDNVRVMDYISGQLKGDIFRLSDCFILNSAVESFGISLIEAVSHGLFVITTPVGIASHAERVFSDGNCIIVPINNGNALRNGILEILDKKVDLDKVKRKNYLDLKRRFDIGPVFDKMKAIYEEVLEGGLG